LTAQVPADALDNTRARQLASDVDATVIFVTDEFMATPFHFPVEKIEYQIGLQVF
jgi:hypothetical protein